MRANQVTCNKLLQSFSNKQVSHGAFEQIHRGVVNGGSFIGRCDFLDVVVSINSRNLFDEVNFLTDICSICRNRDGKRISAIPNRAYSQPREHSFYFVNTDLYPKKRLKAVETTWNLFFFELCGENINSACACTSFC